MESVVALSIHTSKLWTNGGRKVASHKAFLPCSDAGPVRWTCAGGCGVCGANLACIHRHMPRLHWEQCSFPILLKKIPIHSISGAIWSLLFDCASYNILSLLILTLKSRGLTTKNIGLTLKNTDLTPKNMNLTLKNIGLIMKNTGPTSKNTGLRLKNTGLIRRDLTMTNTVLIMENTGLTLTNTGLTLKSTCLTLKNIGLTFITDIYSFFLWVRKIARPPAHIPPPPPPHSSISSQFSSPPSHYLSLQNKRHDWYFT